MGKAHKDRRREKRAQELEERNKDEKLIKEELREEAEKLQLMRKKNESELAINEKSNDTCS